MKDFHSVSCFEAFLDYLYYSYFLGSIMDDLRLLAVIIIVSFFSAKCFKYTLMVGKSAIKIEWMIWLCSVFLLYLYVVIHVNECCVNKSSEVFPVLLHKYHFGAIVPVSVTAVCVRYFCPEGKWQVKEHQKTVAPWMGRWLMIDNDMIDLDAFTHCIFVRFLKLNHLEMVTNHKIPHRQRYN